MLSAAIPVVATWLYLCYIFQGVYTVHETATMSGFVQKIVPFLLHAATAANMLMAVSLIAANFKLLHSCVCRACARRTVQIFAFN